MAKYVVSTEATVYRYYEVDAENEKEAVNKSVDVEPCNEVDICEELRLVEKEREPDAARRCEPWQITLKEDIGR